ncbi:hypothetical protein F4802DRAFT_596989 [Xylaria palmicola]|nr:hypothetical protein F4802DRAFT_596989 [Xylaria palmicola]
MPVSELAWIPSATPGTISPAFLEASWKAIASQDEWMAKHTSTTFPSGRGAALYQQREDSGVMLVTAHWASAAQHAEWIASDVNGRAFGAMAAHAALPAVRFFHVEGALMFGRETLDAGLLSVVRMGVGAGDRQRERAGAAWARAKHLLHDGAGFEHVAGWRIEKEAGKEDVDEFVVVGAWRDGEALARFAKGGEWENALAWEEAWKDVVLEVDIKSYSRIH